MMRQRAIVRTAAARIRGAVDRTCQALREDEIEDEPAFTNRMLGAIAEVMNAYRGKGVTWKAKTLTSMGPGAQESRHGADFAGVLSIELPETKVAKGFLAQAKRIEPDGRMRRDEFQRMKGQCNKMLGRTPDSFVFLYARDGVRVVPAISVVSLLSPRNPHELYSRSVSRFYEEHFESFIGDRRLNAPTPAMLEELDAGHLLYMEVRAE